MENSNSLEKFEKYGLLDVLLNPKKYCLHVRVTIINKIGLEEILPLAVEVDEAEANNVLKFLEKLHGVIFDGFFAHIEMPNNPTELKEKSISI